MKNILYSIVVLLFFSNLVHASLTSKSAIVYYGDDVPYSLVGIHDYIILNPEKVNTITHGFRTYKHNIYAEVSLGKRKANVNALKQSWILGENNLDKSMIMDFSNEAYRDFLYENILLALLDKGFENFYFTHLDVYKDINLSDEKREAIRKGFVAFVQDLHQRYPKVKIIIHKGFDLLDEVSENIEALVVASLFEGFSSKDLSYYEVSREERESLLLSLEKVKAYEIPVIALEYISDAKSKAIVTTIEKLEALNIIPYISDREHLRLGSSSKNPTKRELLLVYDSSSFDKDNNDKLYTSIFNNTVVPIEYLGYIPVLYDINTETISEKKLQQYAGVILWLNGNYATKNSSEFEIFIEKILKNDLKVLIFRGLNPYEHGKIFKLLDIVVEEKPLLNKERKTKFKVDEAYMDFEIFPHNEITSYAFHPKNAKKLCEIYSKDFNSTLAAITPWGGYAFGGASTIQVSDNSLWAVNPFKLFKDALRLKPLAAPDPTTENGKRLLFVHMDGDGFMNRAEWNDEKFSADVLYEDIFLQYKIPQSISIIEAEIAPYGLYGVDGEDDDGDISDQLEDTARKIFALEHIEPVSHTYTHPFFWGKIIDDNLDAKYRLDVKNYDFSLDREISGSLAYINKRLTPKNKKANMIFWSGDCVPSEKTLKYMYQNEILHINGGDTVIVNDKPWLTNIDPFSVKRGDYYQVFTGAQNENVFTNNWVGPFWGYKKVIQTFKLTNSPRRLKPIDIYYHTYSGSKRASLNALHKVYKWSMKQDVMPVYTSYYIPKVLDFYTMALANDNDSWLIKGSGNLKTLRLSGHKDIDFQASEGIVGVKKHENERYIHLDAHSSQLLVLSDSTKDQNYLIDANVALDHVLRQDKRIELVFKGEVPAEIRYHLAKECQLDTQPKALKQSHVESTVSLSFMQHKGIHVIITCK
ncbi:MAG: hypothetical protein U9N52_03535 [Campylobacterota bacterium]|nr:hypothetical protein [Campylobacterota bacterium]